MTLIIKKFFIMAYITLIFYKPQYALANQLKIDDYGLVTLMYHRFEENKYPSTNIKINDFQSYKINKDEKISSFTQMT